jgi:hypothetical protein
MTNYNYIYTKSCSHLRPRFHNYWHLSTQRAMLTQDGRSCGVTLTLWERLPGDYLHVASQELVPPHPSLLLKISCHKFLKLIISSVGPSIVTLDHNEGGEVGHSDHVLGQNHG